MNIETATQVCSVGVSRQGETIALKESDEKNIHAARVTLFAEEVCRQAGLKMDELTAVAVSMGPGSYTGLRIGVSAAKGFCYGLDIPLIAVPSLQAMAYGARLTVMENGYPEGDILFCPMIDARRMEVYTALYDHEGIMVRDTEAMIVGEGSFANEREDHTICFFGDGAEKCKNVLDHKRMIFLEGNFNSAVNVAVLAHRKFINAEFENLAYFEPYYLKDFIAGKPRVKGLD